MLSDEYPCARVSISFCIILYWPKLANSSIRVKNSQLGDLVFDSDNEVYFFALWKFLIFTGYVPCLFPKKVGTAYFQRYLLPFQANANHYVYFSV